MKENLELIHDNNGEMVFFYRSVSAGCVIHYSMLGSIGDVYCSLWTAEAERLSSLCRCSVCVDRVLPRAQSRWLYRWSRDRCWSWTVGSAHTCDWNRYCLFRRPSHPRHTPGLCRHRSAHEHHWTGNHKAKQENSKFVAFVVRCWPFVVLSLNISAFALILFPWWNRFL